MDITRKGVIWQREQSLDRVNIRTTDQRQRMTHWKRTQRTTLRADFVVEVDEAKLLAMMIGKAQRNRTGRAVALGGIVKVTRRNLATLSTADTENPIRPGWEEYED